MIRKTTFSLILFLSFLSLPAFCEGDLSESKIDSLVHLNELVVSANKIQVNRNNIPLTITLINREQIEASSESSLLPVLSQRIPGLFVTQKGVTGYGVSSGSAGTVNIRGVGQGNKVLMLFDGQPQWAGVFGHALPDTYIASDVERVEVIRGPGSLLYGSNAMGGVVNIITRQHDRPGRHTQVRLMYGSYNTQKYLINNGYSVGRFSSFVSLNHDRTDGHRPNSSFHITNGFANLGYRINDHFKVKGDVSIAGFKNNNPGTVDRPMLDHTMDILRGTASLNLQNHYERSSGALQAFYNWGSHKINDGYAQGGTPRTFLFHSDDHNMGVLLYQSFRLFEGNSFTAGVDYKNWGGHAWNDSINGRVGEIVDKSVDEIAGYIVAQQDLFDKLSLNAGVRFEHSSAYGNQWIPQAGLAFRPFENNTIKAAFSKGFRSPNLRELYISYPPYSLANPDLKPENMVNYEVSIGQSFLENSLAAELTAFFIDGKDLIQVVSGQLNNIGEFRNKGIEFELNWQPVKELLFSTNYSYLYTNRRMVAAPKHKAFADITWRPGRLMVNLNAQSIFGLYTDAAVDAQDYTLLNAKVSYLFGTQDRGINLFLKGENLTATSYEINNGFPMPRAIFMGGIDFKF